MFILCDSGLCCCSNFNSLVDRPGLLLVRGASLMRGYLGEPQRTAEVIRDGWYVTGDIASIDADGFITITDRLSRFAKIGGEMVPHLRIEDAINEVLGEVGAAVTSIPDDARGEKLDIDGNVLRELEEETGLTERDVKVAPGWTLVQAGPRLGCMKLIEIDATAEAAKRKDTYERTGCR